jgi:nucleoside-diphosphate-sugar epimerase
MHLFFFGMGYSSLATAKAIHELADPKATIAGTTRTEEGVERLAESPYRLHLFDGTKPGSTLGPDLRQATHLVLSIPPNDSGDPAYNQHRADIDAADVKWICYFSTVGVYGDFGGEWIDETAPTRPVNKRSQQRVEIEQLWRDYAAKRGIPILVLRLAGIYGPGRSSFDKLREGTARRIVKPGQVFNRIHVDDIARMLAAAIDTPAGHTIYNLSDDEPAPPQDVVAYAAELLGLPVPPDIPFEQAGLTGMAASFWAEAKRVSNARIKTELGVALDYPTYREGLRAIVAGA